MAALRFEGFTFEEVKEKVRERYDPKHFVFRFHTELGKDGRRSYRVKIVSRQELRRKKK